MAKANVRTPKGTRDFGAEVMRNRQFIMDTLRTTFELFGFEALETPAMENLNVLEGKYGEEGDQLLFRILNSGEYLKKTKPEDYEAGEQALTPKIAEKGLRYDLTVPFARYVSMNRSQITLPYRRYQMQPVWRGDRPQKGRYREFYQCDADIVGSDSPYLDAEMAWLYVNAFQELGLEDFEVRINNRKILSALAETCGQAGKETELCVAIDKLDKIGKEGVEKELAQRGFAEGAIEKLQPLLTQSTFDVTLAQQLVGETETGSKGIAEVQQLWAAAEALGIAHKIKLDLALARGLNYYTGTIYEVQATTVEMGSIGGGGRYDDLTDLFGWPGVSGIGISFGLERIYEVMEELGLFPKGNAQGPRVLITRFGEGEFELSLELLKELRQAGISAELFPETSKMKKQLNYADKKGFAYVLFLGEKELAQNKLSIKNMQSGEQEAIPREELIHFLSQQA